MNTRVEQTRVRVVMHMDDPFTKLEVINEKGQRLHHPGFTIPRSCIPPHLRKIGSQFFLRRRVPIYEEGRLPTYEELVNGQMCDPEYSVIAIGPGT